MATIKHYLLIRSSKDKIYEAITTQQGLSSWWTKTCTAKPEIGFVNQFNFEQFYNRMKVIDLEINKQAEWECLDGADDWIGTHVIFSIVEKNDGKLFLDFRHAGWETDNIFFAECCFKWGMYLLSLKHLLENGKGHPFPDTW